MKRAVLFLFLVLLFISCSKKTEQAQWRIGLSMDTLKEER